MSDMAETNSNGKTVKELINDLSGRVEAYAVSQSAANAHLQTQITAVATAQAVHEAGDGHTGLTNGLARVEGKLDAVLIAMAEGKGERKANDRTWKIVAAIAGLPGVGALLALLLGFDPTGQN